MRHFWTLILCFGLSVPLAAEGGLKDDLKQLGHSIGHTVKDGCKTVGHASKDAVKAAGPSTKKAAKAVGHGTKKAAKAVGHDAKDAWNGK
jgi:hypothetical protein